MTAPTHAEATMLDRLAAELPAWAAELGFQRLGIADTDLSAQEPRLLAWLASGFHGEMAYMARHGTRRSRPAELEPGTLRVISTRMDYWPASAAEAEQALEDPARAYVSRYALGRDYHKLIRQRLQRLADRMRASIGPFGYRAFVDSAPVMEKPLAVKAGLGWVGKHTNLIDRQAGSWFFLGELYTDLPLPVSAPRADDHCGRCTACIDACPTDAIVEPYRLDARRCISYLTIELHGPIPLELRPLIGNRVFGCDDCQLVCPWNRFARPTAEEDFQPRHGLDAASLLELFGWTEQEFLERSQGSPIRRIGYERWQRNLAVGLGNARRDPAVVAALKARLDGSSPMVREHLTWALERQTGSRSRDLSAPNSSTRRREP